MSKLENLYLPGVTETSWLGVIHPYVTTPDGKPIKRNAKAVLHLADGELMPYTEPSNGYQEAVFKANTYDSLFAIYTKEVALPVEDSIRPFGVVFNGLTRVVFRRDYVMEESEMHSTFNNPATIPGLGETALWSTQDYTAKVADKARDCLPYFLTTMDGMHVFTAEGARKQYSKAQVTILQNAKLRDTLPLERQDHDEILRYQYLTGVNGFLYGALTLNTGIHESLNDVKEIQGKKEGNK